MSTTPSLVCPNCGEPLIPPSGRGGFDDDGNYIEHREACRCPHCAPMWFDDAPPVRCACGITARVEVDDEHAYAREIEP